MVEETAGAVRQAIDALRSTGLWYGTLTATTVLFAWFYADLPGGWEAWPPPFRCAAWGWLAATALAPLYWLLQGPLLEKLAERWRRYKNPPPPPKKPLAVAALVQAMARMAEDTQAMDREKVSKTQPGEPDEPPP